MDNTMAANIATDTIAATAAENPATSQIDTGVPAASEQNTTPVQQDNAAQTVEAAEPDVTQTQVFAARLKESTEKARAEARAEIEKEYAAKVSPEVSYTPEEAQSLESGRDVRFAALVENGMSEVLAIAKANEEMNTKGNSLLSGKKATAKAAAEHAAELEAERNKNTPLAEENAALKAELEKYKATEKVKASNDKAAAASTGPLGGEPAADHDLSEEEWDKQTPADKEKNIKNGKYWKWAPKWTKK